MIKSEGIHVEKIKKNYSSCSEIIILLMMIIIIIIMIICNIKIICITYRTTISSSSPSSSPSAYHSGVDQKGKITVSWDGVC